MKRLLRRSPRLRWQLSLSYTLVMLMTIPTLLVVGWATIVLTSAPGLSPSAQLVQSLEKQTNNEATGWVPQKFLRKAAEPGMTHESLLHDILRYFGSEAFLSRLDVNHMRGGAIISDTGQTLGIFYKKEPPDSQSLHVPQLLGSIA